MMGISEAVQVIGAIIGLLIMVGGGLALVRGSYNKARIQALREDNDDLRKRVDDMDREAERERSKVKTLTDKVTHLENENTLLTSLVTQRADVDTVLTELRDLQRKAEAHWARMSDAMEKLVNRSGA
jgi:chromosome segregation ATPase